MAVQIVDTPIMAPIRGMTGSMLKANTAAIAA